MHNYDLSILIPFYHGNTFINQTLSSIENKFYGNLNYEIILINDSPDEKIILDKSYKNLSIVENEQNLGIAESRNKAYSKSSGKYILFLDQDDLISQNNNIEDILQYEKKLYILNFYEYSNGKQSIFYKNRAKKYIQNLNEYSLIKIGPVFKTVSQFVFLRELFEPFIKSQVQGADDFFFYCDLYKNTNPTERQYVETPQIIYRIHENNYSKKTDFFASLNEIFTKWNERNGNKYFGFEKYYMSKAVFWRIKHKILKYFLMEK